MDKVGRSWFSILMIAFAIIGWVPIIAQGGKSATAATAPTVGANSGWLPNVGKGMTPLEVLVAEDQIRQKYSLYTLMLDGDNLTPVKDSKAWAEALFTKDAVFQSIGPEGQLRRGPEGGGVVGREAIEKTFGPTGSSGARPRDANPPVQTVGRHFPIDIVFDELTPTTAKTRATAMLTSTVFRGDPTKFQQRISFTVYHDTWRKEADGQWRKSETLNYFSTCSGDECKVSPEEAAKSAVRTR